MSQAKGQLTQDMLSFLAAIIAGLLGRNITELDVRTICKEAGITAVGQSELSPALRELRDSLETTPKARLSALMEMLPENLQLALLMIALSFIEFRVGARFQEIEVKTSSLQQELAASEQNGVLAKEEGLRNAEERARLEQALENATSCQSESLERIKKLEHENALLQGRLMEREASGKRSHKTATPPDSASTPKRRRKNSVVSSSDTAPE